jgi:hypothetical protein
MIPREGIIEPTWIIYHVKIVREHDVGEIGDPGGNYPVTGKYQPFLSGRVTL